MIGHSKTCQSLNLVACSWVTGVDWPTRGIELVEIYGELRCCWSEELTSGWFAPGGLLNVSDGCLIRSLLLTVNWNHKQQQQWLTRVTMVNYWLTSGPMVDWWLGPSQLVVNCTPATTWWSHTCAIPIKIFTSLSSLPGEWDFNKGEEKIEV